MEAGAKERAYRTARVLGIESMGSLEIGVN